MLEVIMKMANGRTVEIKPYQPFHLILRWQLLHYGQAIFEGIKAYKNEEGEVLIFSGLTIILNALIFLQKEWKCRQCRKKFLWKV